MNLGRAPTSIGGDGIDPFLDVPHWYSPPVKRMLRHHRVDYRILDGYIQRVGSDDPDNHKDRFVFPGSDPEWIQALVDSLTCD